MRVRTILLIISFFVSTVTAFSMFENGKPGERNGDGLLGQQRQAEMDGRNLSERVQDQAGLTLGIARADDQTMISEQEDLPISSSQGLRATVASDRATETKKAIVLKETDSVHGAMEIKNSSELPFVNSYFEEQEQTASLFHSANSMGHNTALIPVTQKMPAVKKIEEAVKKIEEEHQAAQDAVRTASNEYANAFQLAQVAPLNPVHLKQRESKMMEAIKRLEAATEKLNDQQLIAGQSYEAIPLENQVNSSGQITIYGDADHNLLDEKEIAPLQHSLIFGARLCTAITQKEEQDFINLCNETKAESPFGGMNRDLMRATFETADHKGENALYSMEKASSEDTSEGRLDEIMSLIGDNGYLRIAIANLMYQKGLATIEQIASGISDENVSSEEIKAPQMMGPIHMQLVDSTRYPKKEQPSYHLDKTIDHGESIFTLTLKNTRINQLNNIDHHIVQFLTFELSENPNFDRTQAISTQNIPVLIRCRNGGIVRSFEDKRTSEERDLYEAKYNYAVASQNKDVSPRELYLANCWKDLKQAEYNVSEAQRENEKAIITYPQRLQTLGARPFPMDSGVAAFEKGDAEQVLQAASMKLENAKTILEWARHQWSELVPSIDD